MLHDIRPGACFTNNFLTVFQIRWKLCLAVILLPSIRSQQNFAHTMPSQLSRHVQNFVAITELESRWECNEISIEFELRWKKTLVKWGPVAQIPQCTSPISNNASSCNRNVHMCAHFCYKMVHCGIWDQCIVGLVCVHISVTKWCIVGYGIGALWDMGLVHCGICEMGLLEDSFLRWI